MRIARVRFEGRTATAVISGRTAHFVHGGPFGRLERTGESAPLSRVRLLPPTQPSKIVAIGLNYADHLGTRPMPERPEPFLKTPSSLIGHGDTILLPRDAGLVEQESEVVVVIGRRAQRVAEADVDRYIFGYTCGNDVSARAWQRGDLQWWRAKSADTFTPVGPWIETGLQPDDIALEGRVNGETKQQGNTAHLIYSIRRCIAHITSAMTLERGDLVFTGTPGVPPALQPGDVSEVEIAGLGVLRNPVALAP